MREITENRSMQKRARQARFERARQPAVDGVNEYQTWYAAKSAVLSPPLPRPLVAAADAEKKGEHSS